MSRPNVSLNLFQLLPYDVIHCIFSLLSQADCLECMAVSKEWYSLVPQYSCAIWSEVEIEGCRKGQRFIACLGPHVHHVTISQSTETQVHAILRTLARTGCTRVSSLEFLYCQTTNQTRLLDSLIPLALSITKLVFSKHNDNLAFLHIFAACNRLTHFSYSCINNTANIYSTEPLPLTELPDNLIFDQLLYLCLDVVMDKHKRLAPILQKCPGLRYLAVCNIDPDSDFYRLPSHESIDLELMLHVCPALTYLECNSWEPTCRDNDIVMTGNPASGLQHYHDTPGLRHLITREAASYSGTDIVPVLERHQRTLRVLKLGGPLGNTLSPGGDWSRFRTIAPPLLHTLSLKYLPLSVDELNMLLNQCPALEEVALWTLDETLPPPMALTNLPRLQRLDLCRYSMMRQRRAFLSALHGVQFLVLRSWGKNIADLELAAIGDLDRLTDLVLLNSASGVTEEGMSVFSQKARGLRRLDLFSAGCLSQTVFEAWAAMPRLETLRLVCCRGLTRQGVRALVDTSKSLSQFRAEYCDLTDRTLLDYVERKLVQSRDM